MTERTLAILKPDAVSRGLIGEALLRLEHKGLRIVGLKMLQVTPKDAERLYQVHKGKSFYEDLLSHITSAPIVAVALEAPRAVATLRAIIGSTDPLNATPGSIRGDFGLTLTRNVIHASDSPENATAELAIFFPESDFIAYHRSDENWL